MAIWQNIMGKRSLFLTAAFITAVFAGCTKAEEYPDNPEQTDTSAVETAETAETVTAESKRKTWEDYEYTEDKFGNAIITGYTGHSEDITIPQKINGLTVVQIGGSAFEGADIFQAVIPEGVREIGERAFDECGSLTEVILPESTVIIGDRAFISCTNLKSINIPDGVRTVGEWAFMGCSELSGVTLPESLEILGEGAFTGCGLTDITIPAGVSNVPVILLTAKSEDTDKVLGLNIGA
ncbi:MAG: leucine-rich repeat protein, partial [Ruminococcus sp.]|nr:leucine-rich repeat protein [Ruminococcus sp.]